MSDLAVAKRYATALFQLAQEKNLLDQFEEELRAVQEVFSKQKELIDFLEHPKATEDAKKQMILISFASLSTQVKNTLLIMIERHRTFEIADMAVEFNKLVNEAKSVAEATVYTVRILTDEELAAVDSTFSAKVGKKKLKITNIIDSSMIGGIKLQIGNRIYDGSVSGKLERLNRQLLS